ncbi:hypothetical protein G3N56_05070 [Desulfovibrio sulfodismutans]|uniref:Acylneuraminate cytidylyltransferase family protein n=1 Tax=Desulfolutivibrio sulfodismutans TaxID=63561 RepID=A0A7K3NJ47_9BACT|nr:hypothetical protein [Desulfolutivibrio sulfodismutans]NDY56117.1 hypothetical protein [Desulfolutivibrio sulfodismutans]QLA13170.1 hypothetical protein GD606_13280 [Desulfolutivibrio sulfodismutans DSM 3696]
MFSDKFVVGIIVARGGGSTFYRKNAFPVQGRPVLAWAIDIMRSAGFIDKVFVWTEDAELKRITEECGAVALHRPREMVHYFSGYHSISEWNQTQGRQMYEHLGRKSDYLVSYNCNCICFRPESLVDMMQALHKSRERALRIQGICRVESGLCLVSPKDGRLFPFWNDQEQPLDTNPQLYRIVGVGIMNHTVPHSSSLETLYHEVLSGEGFDFQNEQDIPIAEYCVRSHCNNTTRKA